MSAPENVECPTCGGSKVNIVGWNDTTAIIDGPCPDCTPENVEEQAEADIAACNLGEPMTADQVREAMRKLRRLADRTPPENVECQTCEGSGLSLGYSSNRTYPCPDCTPENVEEPK
jgi:hypothetical protein